MSQLWYQIDPNLIFWGKKWINCNQHIGNYHIHIGLDANFVKNFNFGTNCAQITYLESKSWTVISIFKIKYLVWSQCQISLKMNLPHFWDQIYLNQWLGTRLWTRTSLLFLANIVNSVIKISKFDLMDTFLVFGPVFALN